VGACTRKSVRLTVDWYCTSGGTGLRNLKILLGQQMPEPDADSNDTARKNASRVGRLHSGQPISSEDTGSRNRTARATRALRSDRDHGAENASKRTQIYHPFPSAVNLAVPCRSRRTPTPPRSPGRAAARMAPAS
jgi:hypothetical protein